MLFSDILGLPHIKKHLTSSADAGRIPHAQLFVGPEGCGLLPMALAYSQYVVCNNQDGENENGSIACNLKFNSFSHPDVHFAFPVSNSDKVKSHAVSNHYMQEWRQFMTEQPYGNLFDWYRLIEIEKKQGQIGVDEALDIVKKLSLKSYEGGYKVMLIWMAEKMNTSAANKLLKLIEEPPEKTVFLLLCEDEEQIIQTIRSRCQILHFPPLPEDAIAAALLKKEVPNKRRNALPTRPTGILTRPWICSITIPKTWFLKNGSCNGYVAHSRPRAIREPFMSSFFGVMSLQKQVEKRKKNSWTIV